MAASMSEEKQIISKMAEKLVMLKQEFARIYDGNSHIQEIIPRNPAESMPVSHSHLEHLHRFARHNPIYHHFVERDVSNVSCIVYEGDINSYWLNSIKHGSSCQPFYPTWILSAYITTLNAKSLGCSQIVDIGSGDGRIAYCGKILGLGAHSIEIDDVLVGLQSDIAKSTGVHFEHTCSDATIFDYSSIESGQTAFFIGGLPQMGGDILANSAIERILRDDNRGKGTMFVFAGSHSKRDLSSNVKNGGWDTLIKKYGLKVIDVMSLPTVWTFDQTIETPYIFTSL